MGRMNKLIQWDKGRIDKIALNIQKVRLIELKFEIYTLEVIVVQRVELYFANRSMHL